MRKKSVFASFAAAAVLCLCVPAAAETFTSEDGVLSIELPNENWREITDVNKWIALSDGGNSITVEHYSNGEKLPDITVADNHYVNVYQAVFSTQNEVFIITERFTVSGLVLSTEMSTARFFTVHGIGNNELCQLEIVFQSAGLL